MVEDDEVIAEFLGKYFRDKEYEMTYVIKPSQGLNAIKKQDFDIIILLTLRTFKTKEDKIQYENRLPRTLHRLPNQQ